MNLEKINYEKIKNITNPLIYGKKPKLYEFVVEFIDNIKPEKLVLNEKDYNFFIEKREVARNKINFHIEQHIENNNNNTIFKEVVIEEKNVKTVLYPKNKLQDLINLIDDELKTLYKEKLDCIGKDLKNSSENSDDKTVDINHEENIINYINNFIKEISPLLENQIETKENNVFYIETINYNYTEHNVIIKKSKLILTNSLGKVFKWFINNPFYSIYFRIFMSNFNFNTNSVGDIKYEVSDSDWLIDHDYDSTPFSARKVIDEIQLYNDVSIDLIEFFNKIFTATDKLTLINIIDSDEIIKL